MNDLYLCLYILPFLKKIEVKFDTSLSLNENTKHLKAILDVDIGFQYLFVDVQSTKVLDGNISLDQLGLTSPAHLYLYCFVSC